MVQLTGNKAFQKISKTVLPRIDGRWQVENLAENLRVAGGHLPFSVWAEHFATYLSFQDGQNGTVGVLQSHLDEWEVPFSDLCFFALNNLANQTPMKYASMDVDGQPDFHEFLWEGVNFPARMPLNDLWQLPVPGKPLMAAIAKDRLLLLGDKSVLGLLTVLEDFNKLEKDGYSMPPMLVQGPKEIWMPPRDHDLYSVFREHYEKYMSAMYAQQQTALTKVHGQNNSVFIAKYLATQDKQGTFHSSASVTETVKETLLPEVERVIFNCYDLNTDSVRPAATATWTEVLQLFGDRMFLQEFYPKRYIFHGFPTDQELSLLNAQNKRQGIDLGNVWGN